MPTNVSEPGQASLSSPGESVISAACSTAAAPEHIRFSHTLLLPRLFLLGYSITYFTGKTEAILVGMLIYSLLLEMFGLLCTIVHAC